MEYVHDTLEKLVFVLEWGSYQYRFHLAKQIKARGSQILSKRRMGSSHQAIAVHVLNDGPSRVGWHCQNAAPFSVLAFPGLHWTVLRNHRENSWHEILRIKMLSFRQNVDH
jgi:hypothetical protein